MKKPIAYSLFIWLILICPSALWAQKPDSTKVEEEVILLSSEMPHASDLTFLEYELKPIFRHLTPWERTQLFRVGLRPTFRTLPGAAKVENPGQMLSVRYDRKFANSSFSIGVESALRLYDLGDKGYDYKSVIADHQRQVFLFDRTWRNGSYYSNIISTDINLRFYYQQKRRLRVQASGNNFSQGFFYAKMLDVFNFSRKRTFEIERVSNPFMQRPELLNLTDRRQLMVQPAYFMMGWGIQRQFFEHLWIELQLGLGGRFFGSDGIEHFDNDAVYEANFFVGWVFGKSKKLNKK